MFYILKGIEPERVTDALLWSQEMEQLRKHDKLHVGFYSVKKRNLIRRNKKQKRGGVKASQALVKKLNKWRCQDVIVSTVFLGIDHNHFGSKPILWETMIFGGRLDGYQERYETFDDALFGHGRAVRLL